jgi:hypothetical protein
MDRAGPPRRDGVLRATVAALQDAGYVLVAREQAGLTSHIQLCDRATTPLAPPTAVQLTHVCDPGNPHVELATPDRILSWYYPTAFPPAPADVVAILCTTARRP